MGNRIKDDQISFIKDIKDIFLLSIRADSRNELNETTKNIPEAANSIDIQNYNIAKIDQLIERIEKLEKILGLQQERGIRKSRVKEQIISLLEQHKKLTSSQLSKLIGLSRTRCSEYFRELTREGITEGIIVNRQKYYKLVKK